MERTQDRPSTHETDTSTWLRLRLPTEAHASLKEMARAEGRGLANFLTSLLVDAAAGNYAIGEPSNEDICVRKPSNQPLSIYARDARHIILMGTTLRSARPFIDFLHSKVAEGARLSFMLVAEELFKNEILLEQVAQRQGRTAYEVYEELQRTTRDLEELQHHYLSNVSVVKLHSLPTFGLTVVDPFEQSAKMRVSFYMYKRPPESNPALHIQPSTMESRYIFSLFMAHYDHMVFDANRFEALRSAITPEYSKKNSNGDRTKRANPRSDYQTATARKAPLSQG